MHTIWSTEEAIGEYFKDTWVRLIPNSPIPFMSDITNESNEYGDIDNVMIEVKVCYFGTL